MNSRSEHPSSSTALAPTAVSESPLEAAALMNLLPAGWLGADPEPRSVMASSAAVCLSDIELLELLEPTRLVSQLTLLGHQPLSGRRALRRRKHRLLGWNEAVRRLRAVTYKRISKHCAPYNSRWLEQLRARKRDSSVDLRHVDLN